MSNYITPTGVLGYVSLTTAQGFKGSEENRSFNAQLILSGKEGVEFLEMLEGEYVKLHKSEVDRQKSKGGFTRFPVPMVRLKEISPGSFQLNFNRKEGEGAPAAIDVSNKQIPASSVGKGSSAKVAFQLVPYLLPTGIFGVSHKLLAIKLEETTINIEDVASLFGSSTKVVDSIESKVAIKDLF